MDYNDSRRAPVLPRISSISRAASLLVLGDATAFESLWDENGVWEIGAPLQYREKQAGCKCWKQKG